MKLNQARLHFVGIGGVGMAGIAELFHAIGAKVSGSDQSENANTDHLKSLGVTVYIGHHAEQVKDVDALVYSSAISQANPEMIQARKLRIPLIPRAEALAELMRLKRGIAIAGAHGKTTTTSMTSHIFLNTNQRPTVVIGGRLKSLNSGAHFDDGDWLIAEADESDGSFSKLSPEVAVITNVDNDHLDYFKSFDNILNAFYQFALRVPFYGYVLACGDHHQLRTLFEVFPKKLFFYGFEEHNDYQIKKESNGYALYFKQELLGHFKAPLMGRHNVLNAVASLIVSIRAGVDFETAALALANFSGVERRLHHLGNLEQVEYFSDYAHHPTELKASIEAFQEMYPGRKILGVFQPHRYSRTEFCWSEFLTCFQGLDHAFIMDIYAAGEKPIQGVTSQNLVTAIGLQKVSYLSLEELIPGLKAQISSGTVVVFFGAGDIYRLAKETLPRLAKSLV